MGFYRTTRGERFEDRDRDDLEREADAAPVRSVGKRSLVETELARHARIASDSEHPLLLFLDHGNDVLVGDATLHFSDLDSAIQARFSP
jgi:hypothetical protein